MCQQYTPVRTLGVHTTMNKNVGPIINANRSYLDAKSTNLAKMYQNYRNFVLNHVAIYSTVTIK